MGFARSCYSEPWRPAVSQPQRERDQRGVSRAARGLNGALGSRRAILDGEIVAFNAEGRPSFEALQSRIHLRGESAVREQAQRTPVTLMLFDLLWLDGRSLIDLPYTERRGAARRPRPEW